MSQLTNWVNIPHPLQATVRRDGSVANVRVELRLFGRHEGAWKFAEKIRFSDYRQNQEIKAAAATTAGELYLVAMYVSCEETPLGGDYNVSLFLGDKEVFSANGDVDTTPGKLDVYTSDPKDPFMVVAVLDGGA